MYYFLHVNFSAVSVKINLFSAKNNMSSYFCRTNAFFLVKTKGYMQPKKSRVRVQSRMSFPLLQSRMSFSRLSHAQTVLGTGNCSKSPPACCKLNQNDLGPATTRHQLWPATSLSSATRKAQGVPAPRPAVHIALGAVAD